MKRIANRLAALAIVVAAPLTVPAQDVATILARDLVDVSEGQFVHTQINRCRVAMSGGDGEEFSQPITVRRLISAPQDLLSRDQFVSISTQLLMRNRIALASILRPGIDPIDALTAVECRRALDLTNAIDFRIEIHMAQVGVAIETTNEKTGKQATDRFEWPEILNFQTD
jgi:hypothetical protein